MINSRRLEGISILSAKTMRRYVQILGLIVLALAAGGWGAVVAAVLCPHAGGSIAFRTGAARSLTVSGEACHSVKPEPVAKQHCHDAEQDAAGAETETPEATPVAVSNSDAFRDGEAFELPQNIPCTHCLSRPEAPSSTLVARQQAEQKRDVEPATLSAATPPTAAYTFAKPVLYRQGAPPGSSTPKHLLIGILLI